MGNNKVSAALINVEIPESIDNALTNLTDQPTRNIGTTLSDIWYLVFGGISLTAEKRKLKYLQDLEQFKLELEEKINKIPPENKIESDIRIVAPALEASKYCVESSEIRSLFSNLIASSMNKETVSQTHPSYVDIAKQLNVLEANLLKYIYNHKGIIPIVKLRQIQYEDQYNNSSIFFDNISSGQGFDIVRCYGAIDIDIIKDIDIPVNQLCSAFDNLSRLGLISIFFDHFLVDNNLYSQFESDTLINDMVSEWQEKSIRTQLLKAKKGCCELTDYGKGFIKICII